MLRWAERIGTQGVVRRGSVGQDWGWARSRGILFHNACKGVLLANRRLDIFFCSSWIIVYIRIGVQLNVPFCGIYWGGTFVVAESFFTVVGCGNTLGFIQCWLRWSGGYHFPFDSRRTLFRIVGWFIQETCMRIPMRYCNLWIVLVLKYVVRDDV